MFRPYNYDIQAVMNLTSGGYNSQPSSTAPTITYPPQQQPPTATFDQLLYRPTQPNIIPLNKKRKYQRRPAQKSWTADTSRYAGSNGNPDFTTMDKMFAGAETDVIDRPIIFEYDPR